MTKNSGTRKSARKGSALVLMTLTIPLVAIPMAGLAIDVSLLYLVKARLVTAVDASALAAARSLSRGADLASQRATATSVATAYFAANFPVGHLLTTNRQFNVSVNETVSKIRTVSATASVDAPLYFLRVLRVDKSTVAAAGMSSRRDVDLMLVLDRSESLDFTSSCAAMKAAAASFVDQFAAGRDKLGLMTFGGSYRVDQSLTVNFKTSSPTMITNINNINCAGFTGTAQALWQAHQQLVTAADAGALNVIVLFTDGQPNSITASFPVKKSTTTYAPTGKSTCKDSAGRTNTNALWNPANKVGVMNGYPGVGTTGITGENAGAIPVTWDNFAIADSDNCYFAPDAYDDSSPNATIKDIAYIPDLDLYGNSTSGYLTNYTYPAGGPYAGKIRVDHHSSSIWDESVSIAATNATDSAATRIRTSTLHPVIFAIGLGGATDVASDVLLHRITNSVSSPVFNPAQPVGLYVYAPTSGQLKDAFDLIASEVLRLAQ